MYVGVVSPYVASQFQSVNLHQIKTPVIMVRRHFVERPSHLERSYLSVYVARRIRGSVPVLGNL